MRKSVIKSMIFGALSVTLISFVIVTLVFFYNIKSTVTNETYDDMDQCIENIKPIAELSLGFSTSKMYSLFDAAMRQISQLTKYDIIICTPDGGVKWYNIEQSPSQVETNIKNALKLFDGKTSIHVGGIFDKMYNTQTLTSGKLVSSQDINSQIVIFCSVPKPFFTEKYINIMLELMLMEFVCLLFMAIFLYFFSRSITSPLSKINKAVKSFSNGNFEKRVEYSSDNELGELAQNINIMAESVQNLEKMRSDFISDISHELRTPMTSISGFVEGILDGTISSEESNKYLEIVLTESKRLSRLVSDLLGISRLDSGKQIINKSNFDVFELMKVVILKFENEVNHKELNINLFSEYEKCVVYADSDSITQVLINLIHNAIKFSDYGGFINLKITEKGKKCLITVENSGSGIDSDKLKYIWQRFYKTDVSRSTDKSGVGLGLYIVKKIIDAHGEEITVSSTPGETTVFSFTLELFE